MADNVKQTSSLPSLREPNRFASTNITNEITTSLGQVLLGDGKGRVAGYSLTPWRIWGNESIEDGRWKYTGRRVIPQRNQAGEAAYIEETPTVETDELWNDLEEKNDVLSTYGNGVPKADLPAGFSIQPIPNSVVVWARSVDVVEDGAIVTEWRFALPNGIAGSCS